MKEDPNDESRFLLENPTRSDFFIVMSMLAVLIEQQDGDSFGISGREETPQERKRREGAGAESDEKAQERKRREGAGAEATRRRRSGKRREGAGAEATRRRRSGKRSLAGKSTADFY
ncbi:hypothetical protein [Priestia megaterium]|uniref:hypothetical protein n=1 Tax=Priestia megaterium TaxID=1404 RepID=UPI0021D69B32|nr:hypothetical protein [Priestia megaterium]MCU7740086.1 hypothetical protein [Priestia megaterium]